MDALGLGLVLVSEQPLVDLVLLLEARPEEGVGFGEGFCTLGMEVVLPARYFLWCAQCVGGKEREGLRGHRRKQAFALFTGRRRAKSTNGTNGQWEVLLEFFLSMHNCGVAQVVRRHVGRLNFHHRGKPQVVLCMTQSATSTRE